MRLLKLPADIQDALKRGVITRSQARTILALNKETDQRALFNEILKQGLSVREIERRVRKAGKRKRTADPFIDDMEEKLQKFFGTKVRIMHTRNNTGRVIIEYYSADDLNRIVKKLL